MFKKKKKRKETPSDYSLLGAARPSTESRKHSDRFLRVIEDDIRDRRRKKEERREHD